MGLFNSLLCCPQPTPAPAPVLVRSGSEVLLPGSSTVIPAGRRSVTLTVRAGNFTASGSLHTTPQQFKAGESFTWSAVSRDEVLASFTVAADATGEATLTWTEN